MSYKELKPNDEVVLVSRTTRWPFVDFPRFDFMFDKQNFRIRGNVIKTYEGDEDYSYHGSPWYADCVDIQLNDGQIFKFNSVESKSALYTADELKEYLQGIDQYLQKIIDEAQTEKCKYAKALEQLDTIFR
jgi:hypothetical protein